MYSVTNRYTSFLIAVVSGTLLGIGSLAFSLWPCSLLSFIGVTYLIVRLPARRLWWHLLLTASITYGCTFWGLYWNTLPLSWLGIESGLGVVLVASVWVLTVLLFAVSLSSFFVLVQPLAQRSWPSLLVIPSTYVLADTLGAFLFSIVFAGHASSLGVHYTIGSPGYQLADSFMLRQGAWVGGLYGLLFVQALCGVCGYWAWRAAPRWVLWPAALWSLGGLIVLINPTAGTLSQLESTFATRSVALLSTYPEEDLGRSQSAQIQSALQVIPTSTDLIALPEDARFIQHMSTGTAAFLQTQFSDSYLVDSGSYSGANGLQPLIQAYHTTRGSVATSSKSFLMIFGEYMPWLYRGIGHGLGLRDIVARLDAEHRYTALPPKLLPVADTAVSVMLCSDATSPILYARDAASGASLLLNLASHSWFHNSTLLHKLAIRVAQVRAAESRRWYVRAGHSSPSVAIDHRGSVVAEQAWFSTEPLLVTVPVRTTDTLYSHLRTGMLAVPFLLIVWVWWHWRRGR